MIDKPDNYWSNLRFIYTQGLREGVEWKIALKTTLRWLRENSQYHT